MRPKKHTTPHATGGPSRAAGQPAAARDESHRVVHYSGVVVMTRPEETRDAVAALNALPLVEVHHADPDTGRIVAVLESDGLERLEETFREVRALPGVLLAAPVCHYVDRPEEGRGTDGEEA